MTICTNCQRDAFFEEKICAGCGEKIIPPNLIVRREGDNFSMTYIPSTRNIVLFYGGIAAFIFLGVLFSLFSGPAPTSWVEVLIVVAAIVIGLGFPLLVNLSIRINKVIFAIERQEAKRDDAPFREAQPPPQSTLVLTMWNLRKKTQTFLLKDVEQIFFIRRDAVKRERNPDMVSTFYDLQIKYKDGLVVPLLPGISEPGIAEHLVSHLEESLAITEKH